MISSTAPAPGLTSLHADVSSDHARRASLHPAPFRLAPCPVQACSPARVAPARRGRSGFAPGVGPPAHTRERSTSASCALSFPPCRTCISLQHSEPCPSCTQTRILGLLSAWNTYVSTRTRARFGRSPTWLHSRHTQLRSRLSATPSCRHGLTPVTRHHYGQDFSGRVLMLPRTRLILLLLAPRQGRALFRRSRTPIAPFACASADSTLSRA